MTSGLILVAVLESYIISYIMGPKTKRLLVTLFALKKKTENEKKCHTWKFVNIDVTFTTMTKSNT
jgi:hypothetical protein